MKRVQCLVFFLVLLATSQSKAEMINLLSVSSSGDINQVSILSPSETANRSFDLDQSEGVIFAHETGSGIFTSQADFFGAGIRSGGFEKVSLGDEINASLLFHFDPPGNSNQSIQVQFEIDTSNLPANSKLILVFGPSLKDSDFLNPGKGTWDDDGRFVNGGDLAGWDVDSSDIIRFKFDLSSGPGDLTEFRFVSFTAVPEPSSICFLYAMLSFIVYKRKKAK